MVICTGETIVNLTKCLIKLCIWLKWRIEACWKRKVAPLDEEYFGQTTQIILHNGSVDLTRTIDKTDDKIDSRNYRLATTHKNIHSQFQNPSKIPKT